MGKYNGNTEFVQKGSTSKLTLKDVFSDMFKRHALRDGERLFMSGMSSTTPAPENMLREWQKPWLFVWVLGACLIVLAIGYALRMMGFNTPTIAFIGTAAVPFAMLIFTWELNIPRNVPAYKLLFMFMAGGMLSLLAVAFLAGLRIGPRGSLLHCVTNGIVEEAAKLVAIVAFILYDQKNKNNHSTFVYILTGLLVGSAIGNGFDAFESGQYFMNTNESFILMQMRAIQAPGGHGAWAAIYGAALVMVKGNSKLRVEHFVDKRFLSYFLATIAIHTIWNWDGVPDIVFNLPLLNIISIKATILTVSAWIILLKLINQGVKQIVDLPIGAFYIPPAPATGSPYIYCVSGEMAGQIFRPIGGTLILGRDPSSCNLLFSPSTPGISRKHCTIDFNRESVMLTDNGSSHGTFFGDGRRLNPHVTENLKAGQRFYLASANTMFEVKF